MSSCPQIWNIELKKDREKEKVGDRPAKLNEKKGNRNLERDIKNKGDSFFVGKTTWKFCSGADKMRNLSGHQCKVKMRGSEKKIEQKHSSVSTEELFWLVTEASSWVHSNYVPDCIYHSTQRLFPWNWPPLSNQAHVVFSVTTWKLGLQEHTSL